MGMNVSLHGQDSVGGLPQKVKATDNALHVTNATALAGERNPSSLNNSYMAVQTEANVTVLNGTAAVTIGGVGADTTILQGIVLIKNAGPATVSIAGFEDQVGNAKSLLFTGSTTADVVIDFGSKGLINSQGSLICTPTVTDTVAIMWRPL